MEAKFVTAGLPGINEDTLDRSVRTDPQQDDWGLWERKNLTACDRRVPLRQQRKAIKFC
jgi:hypothetical protein